MDDIFSLGNLSVFLYKMFKIIKWKHGVLLNFISIS